ncbi:hypothetical protein [Alkaliphilus serpentinus]|uniref:TM2 domain-containing protein n=1 Tax=Alkaliphilus serpentinus TaxID=1482731 RepID=A0A833HPA1_9FIRM|nr:hypothetical protein [Alkaliphilus serpentinus]KAB3530549.1 hypothetical protein F8153_06785 [Alkaliphilus serpentinus]
MKSKLWTFLFSLIPGAGHMYLGMMRRGVQLMALFMLPIMIAGFFRLELFLFILPIIWFYSFFDAMNRGASPEKRVDDDVPIVKWVIHNQAIPYKSSKLLAYGLIIFGGYLLFDRLFMTSMYYYQIPYHTRVNMQTAFLAVIFIAGGVFLLKGSKVKREDEEKCDNGE